MDRLVAIMELLERRRALVRVGAAAGAASLAFAWLSTPDPAAREAIGWLTAIPLIMAGMVWSRPAMFPVSVGLGALAGIQEILTGRSLLLAVLFAARFPLITIAVGAAVRLAEEGARAQRRLVEQRGDLETALDIAYRQLRIEQALVECTKAFLGESERSERDEALHLLAEAAGCDAIIVCRNHERSDEGLVAVAEHWLAPNDPTPAYDEEVPWRRLPNVALRLAAGTPSIARDLADLPYPDRLLYEESPAGIRSLVEIPVMAGGRWVGHVGLIQHTPGRAWSTNEIELVSAVAGMLGARWEREQNVGRLEEAVAQRDRSLQLQAALTDTSRTLLEDDSEDALGQAVQTVVEAAEATIGYVASCYEHTELGPVMTTIAYHARPGSPDPGFRGTMPWSTFPLARAELSRGRPYVVEDVDELPSPERAGYFAGSAPIRSHLAFPVVVDGAMVAVVAVGDLHPRRWTVGELKMVGTVSRMVAAHQQRNRAHQALEELIKAKDRFIASVSHELRTPMAVVMGLSAELSTRRSEFGEHEVEEFIDLIARQSREVASIIEDLLVSARAQETRLTVHPEVFRLDAEVRRVISDLPTEYTWRIGALDLPVMPVYADPMRVRQIVRNLVVNSHRYGGDNVYLSLLHRGDEVLLAVADDGPGVPERRREEIFQPYATINDLPGRTASIGLGLTVSRQLARLMGGDVTYSFNGYSTFELRLPSAARLEHALGGDRRSTLDAELPMKSA